ncbi:MAG: ATP-binding protein [Dehalococcoidia bacterium]|nr:ATP-binding protein [Dehalococcoidia bacterium]
MESLRATGYSLPDAVADLIDNSITAGASNIWLDFHWAGTDSRVSVLDDGRGMSEQELIAAMKVGSKSPLEERASSDLGRYGLGLKTASISQARAVTVASKVTGDGRAVARRWDLDHLATVGDWQLLHVPPESGGVGSERFAELTHGTLVSWDKLDRLVGDVGPDNERARQLFLDGLRAVEEHVAMVFHRFMVPPNPISFWINGQSIRPWDPFLADEPPTQRLSSEVLDPQVTVIPYVLPHHSRLSPDTHRVAGGPAGWNAHQGFYVYRNRRLLVPGDWLGLGFVKEEHYKLARIQIDLPNSLDHEWEIDVRKSQARPPLRYRDTLRRIARAVRQRAVDVYRHRGKSIARSTGRNSTFVWTRRVREKKVSYVINRGHPLVEDALASGSVETGRLRQLLRLIEEYVPIQQIWVDLAEGDESESAPFDSAEEREVIELIRALYVGFIRAGLTHTEALERLGVTEAIGDRFELIEPAVEDLLEETVHE